MVLYTLQIPHVFDNLRLNKYLKLKIEIEMSKFFLRFKSFKTYFFRVAASGCIFSKPGGARQGLDCFACHAGNGPAGNTPEKQFQVKQFEKGIKQGKANH